MTLFQVTERTLICLLSVLPLSAAFQASIYFHYLDDFQKLSGFSAKQCTKAEEEYVRDATLIYLSQPASAEFCTSLAWFNPSISLKGKTHLKLPLLIK